MKIITRKQAKILELKHYFTGKSCKHGHITKRLTSISTCCECIRLNNLSDVHKVWVACSKENKKEYYKQYNKTWCKLNPDKLALNAEYRLERLKERTPKWYEADLVKQLYLRRDELNSSWNLKLEVDHIIPICSETVCGLHCWANLQLLDQPINNSKFNLYQQDW